LIAKDEKVLHKRAFDIRFYYQASFSDLKDQLHLVSWVGQDTVLGYLNRKSSRILPTPLYNHLLEMVADLKPKIITIASAANVFSGSEIDRVQVQQFVSLMTRLARRSNGSVLLISHPSLTGISAETGLSGSTQWHNAVRSRIYLKKVKPTTGEPLQQPDSNLREVVFMKNQYGPAVASIALQYQNGLFLPIEGGNLDAKARLELAKSVFLILLQRFTKENRNVTANSGRGYAPAMFEPEKEVKDVRCVTKNDLAEAMRELLREGKIINETYGRSGHQHSRLVIASTTAPF
jgi:RecA-family ATPase